MPRRMLHEDIKVPVIKNMIYALRIIFKADKMYLIWNIIDFASNTIFTTFIKEYGFFILS